MKVIKTIKISSSKWIKDNKIFPDFTYWQDGYGAFTCAFNDKERLIKYIIDQKEHHKMLTFREEYKILLQESGIKFNEKYLV